MKKFKFRLEQVLHYRTLIKEEKRKALLDKNYKLKLAQDRLQEVLVAQCANELSVGVMSVNQVQLAGAYSAWLENALVNQRLAIISTQHEVEVAMQEYIEASKDARSLELLRERKLVEYRDLVDHDEAKFLDELNTQKGNNFHSQEIEG